MRSHLKKVFSFDIGVETSSQVLDILEYACGLILGPALISTENPNFEMASRFRRLFVSSLAIFVAFPQWSHTFSPVARLPARYCWTNSSGVRLGAPVRTLMPFSPNSP